MRIAWALLALMIAPAVAQDYCSLEVRVVDETGAPVSGVPVNYVEADGDHGSSASSNQEGLVRFCDLGLSPVHVRARCHNTATSPRLEDISLEWQKTVRVTLHVPRNCPFIVEFIQLGPPYSRCTVLLRFETDSRKPIANVTIAGITARASDTGGRIAIMLDNKQSINTTASAPGYAPASVEYTCKGPSASDLFVVLERLPE